METLTSSNPWVTAPGSPDVVVTPPAATGAGEAAFTLNRLGPEPTATAFATTEAPFTAPAPAGSATAAEAAPASTEVQGRFGRLASKVGGVALRSAVGFSERLRQQAEQMVDSAVSTAASIGRVASNAYSRFSTFATLAQSGGGSRGSEVTPAPATTFAATEATPAATGSAETTGPSWRERLTGPGARRVARLGAVALGIGLGVMRVRHSIDLGGGGASGHAQEAIANAPQGGGHVLAETIPAPSGPVEANTMVDDLKGISKDVGRFVAHEMGWPQPSKDKQHGAGIDAVAGGGAAIIGGMLGTRTSNWMKDARRHRREATRETVVRTGRGRRRRMSVNDTLDARAVEHSQYNARAEAGSRTGTRLKHMRATTTRGEVRTGTNIADRVPGAINRGPLADYTPSTAPVKLINRRRPSRSIWPYILPHGNRSVNLYGMPRGWRPWRRYGRQRR